MAAILLGKGELADPWQLLVRRGRPMKRIFTFDLIRAIAIIGVIFVHTVQHNWASTDAVEAGEQDPTLMVLVLFYLLTMAGVFYVVMGSVNSYMMYHRVKSGKNTIRQMVMSGLIMGVSLIALHYFFRGVLSADSGILYYLAREGEVILPAAKWLVGTCTLAMLGWTSIVVPAIMALLISGRGLEKPRRNYLILGILGTGILIATPFLRDAFAPYTETWMGQGLYLQAGIWSHLFYDLFPIFPYIGYGLFGAMLGIALARGERRRDIAGILLVAGMILMAVGWVVSVFYGGPDPTNYLFKVSHTAIYMKTFMQYSQLGLFFLFIFGGLLVFDLLSPERRERRQKRFALLQKFSMVSLTIFLLEGVVNAVIRRVLDHIPWIEGWSESLGIVVLVALSYLLVWALIVHIWSKIEFVGSVEWTLLRVIQAISGKRSEKFNLKREMVMDEVPDIVRKEAPTLNVRSSGKVSKIDD